MIAIVNIDKNIRESGEHEYRLMINKKHITTFKHNREEPLSKCLHKASCAAGKAEKEVLKKMLINLTES